MEHHNQEERCPIYYTLSVVGGKWKWAILLFISKNEGIRYGQLKNSLPPIAHKTLSQQLKELEYSQVILRKSYNVIPPKVEYYLTDKGKTIIPIFEQMFQWGEKNMV